tara:strand:+ start:638 stop:925 length:288 start_codon:yes stop_codon:yes gene_type:complete
LGNEPYDGGHIFGTLFLGGGENINIFPQLRAQNQNLHKENWFNMERAWARELDAGNSVRVDIEFKYSTHADIPDSYRGSYRVNQADPENFKFNNL